MNSKFLVFFLKRASVVDTTDVAWQLIPVPLFGSSNSEGSLTKQKSGDWDKHTVSSC